MVEQLRREKEEYVELTEKFCQLWCVKQVGMDRERVKDVLNSENWALEKQEFMINKSWEGLELEWWKFFDELETLKLFKPGRAYVSDRMIIQIEADGIGMGVWFVKEGPYDKAKELLEKGAVQMEGEVGVVAEEWRLKGLEIEEIMRRRPNTWKNLIWDWMGWKEG